MSNMKWSLGNVFRASKLCDVLRIKAQSILRNEKSTFYTSLCVRGDGGFSSAVSTLIINWIVFHQIALKTQNAQLEADLQHLLTTEHKLPNKLQYEIAGIYHHFSRLTNSTCLGSVRDFLIANIGWSVGSNRIVPPVCYAFELWTFEKAFNRSSNNLSSRLRKKRNTNPLDTKTPHIEQGSVLFSLLI